MDQTTLVEDLKADGLKLLESLVQDGIVVTAACWLRESESGQWFLYIASPIVSDDGATRDGYRRILPVIRQMPQPFWVDPFEVKIISPKDPIAEAVQALHRRYASKRPFHFRGDRLGSLSIEGAYIYPPVTAQDQKEEPLGSEAE